MIRRAIVAAIAGMVFATPAFAQNLETIIDRFADHWARGDASALTTLASRKGVSFDIDGKPLGPVASRQASAVLRRVFNERETVQVRILFREIVGGQPPLAFAEINWMTRVHGTTIPEKTTVFVALVLEDDHWRVTQIRFVKP